MKNSRKLSKNSPLILAIDTSCDETSVAVLRGIALQSNVVASQTELHKKWGGVVPMVARRAHEENLGVAVDEALKRAGVRLEDIEYIAGTQGPGLAIDLEVGLNWAKSEAIRLNKPFVPVNHMEGHLLSALIQNSKGVWRYGEIDDAHSLFPAVGMLVSGKHTEIHYVPKIGQYMKLGYTLDDAAGEAFDKVGRMLNFGYPGGPIISEFAKKGEVGKIALPIPMQKSDDLLFSYSGLKTACLYRLNELRESGLKDRDFANDFCAQFVESIVRSLEIKLNKALNQLPPVKSLFVGGGVLHNESVSRRLGRLARARDLSYFLPEKRFRSDNAAMIGVAANFMIERGEFIVDAAKINEIDRIPRFELGVKTKIGEIASNN